MNPLTSGFAACLFMPSSIILLSSLEKPAVRCKHFWCATAGKPGRPLHFLCWGARQCIRHLQEPVVSRPGTFQFAASPKRVAQARQIPETAAEAHRAALLVQVRARRGQALRSGRTDLRWSNAGSNALHDLAP